MLLQILVFWTSKLWFYWQHCNKHHDTICCLYSSKKNEKIYLPIEPFTKTKTIRVKTLKYTYATRIIILSSIGHICQRVSCCCCWCRRRHRRYAHECSEYCQVASRYSSQDVCIIMSLCFVLHLYFFYVVVVVVVVVHSKSLVKQYSSDIFFLAYVPSLRYDGWMRWYVDIHKCACLYLFGIINLISLKTTIACLVSQVLKWQTSSIAKWAK